MSMRIWKKPISVGILTMGSLNTATSHLGIEFLEVGDDFITARVPVMQHLMLASDDLVIRTAWETLKRALSNYVTEDQPPPAAGP